MLVLTVPLVRWMLAHALNVVSSSTSGALHPWQGAAQGLDGL